MREFFGATSAQTSAKQRTPLDIVIYLASLASNPRAVDATMDSVRGITAALKPGEPLGAADTKLLGEVYANLENYLTHDEPLRVYTKESIQQKILNKFWIGKSSISEYWQDAVASQSVELKPVSAATLAHAAQLRKWGWTIVGGALILGAASMFLPAQPCDPMRWCNNVDMGVSVASDLILFGGALLFLKGLGGFKAQFKVVYRLLCAAMLLLALAQSQQPLYTELGLWGVPFISHGGAALGFVPAIALFYLSMYLFARLLRVKQFVTSVWAVIGTTIAVTVICLSVPNFPSPLPSEVLRAGLPPLVLLNTLLAYAALMVLAVKKTAAAAYTPALAWLFLGLATIALSTLTYTLIQVFAPSGDNVFLSYGGVSALFMIAGVLFVRSGVVFNQITEA